VLVGDAATTASDPVAPLVAGLDAQAATLPEAVAQLTASEHTTEIPGEWRSAVASMLTFPASGVVRQVWHAVAAACRGGGCTACQIRVTTGS
jgi:hypothetical protein